MRNSPATKILHTTAASQQRGRVRSCLKAGFGCGREDDGSLASFFFFLIMWLAKAFHETRGSHAGTEMMALAFEQAMSASKAPMTRSIKFSEHGYR